MVRAVHCIGISPLASGWREPLALRVLVVDNLALHRMMAAVLESTQGAAPLFARTGSEAVLLAKISAFDLILIDVDKSVLAGMVTAARIRRVEQAWAFRRRARIVAYASDQATLDDCLVKGSGLNGAIKNPGTIDSVCACLERWFTAPAAAGP